MKGIRKRKVALRYLDLDFEGKVSRDQRCLYRTVNVLVIRELIGDLMVFPL